MRLLIANRGEIAVRIARSARKLGMEVVSLIPQEEKKGLLPGLSDTVIEVNSTGIFTDIGKLVNLARENHCGLVHPGYGFLSEQAAFAHALVENQILFVGPSSKTLAIAGDKECSKQLARRAHIPVLPEYSSGELPQRFPVVVKPVGGGGGKGMNIAHSAKELTDFVADAKRIANRLYGNQSVLIEEYLPDARHIEVQLLADTYGRIIHLFDRDCSIQRGFQKVIEEAPASAISQVVREQLYDYAGRFAHEAGFFGAGTVEFLVCSDDRVFFLEMNPRIQVEHPVTEAITGIDIVEWQLRITLGQRLPFTQDAVVSQGHAIEWRLNAEIPSEGFRASAGEIVFFEAPKSTQVRVDTWLNEHGHISPDYDSLIAKIVIHASTREEAVRLSQSYLNDKLVLGGVSTNQGFLQKVSSHPLFIDGRWTTSSLGHHTEVLATDNTSLTRLEKVAIAVGFVYLTWLRPDVNRIPFTFNKARIAVDINGDNLNVEAERQFGCWKLSSGDSQEEFTVEAIANKKLLLTTGEQNLSLSTAVDSKGNLWLECNGRWCVPRSPWLLRHRVYFTRSQIRSGPVAVPPIVSPLYGAIAEVFITEGREVNPGDQLLTIESMKTENIIRAPAQAIVRKVLVKKTDRVTDKSILVEFV